jgi:hypothetical protein
MEEDVTVWPHLIPDIFDGGTLSRARPKSTPRAHVSYLVYPSIGPRLNEVRRTTSLVEGDLRSASWVGADQLIHASGVLRTPASPAVATVCRRLLEQVGR